MPWRRLGLVFEPRAIGLWGHSHAALPFVHAAPDGSLQLYFTTRDRDNRSHTAVADMQLDVDGTTVIEPRPEPVLSPGALGGFDDCGAMGSCIVADGDRLLLYYVGWSLTVTVPFAHYIGLAISEDGGRTFERAYAGPVVGRTRCRPLLATAPWVLRDEDGYRLWYTNGVRWEPTPDGPPRHYYRVEHTRSANGIDWDPGTDVCIDFADASEYAHGRPMVVRDEDRYRLWFSCRGSAYRIDYAESDDGTSWTRLGGDHALDPAGSGWESDSVEYGGVFDHLGRRWMLYNGNGYGSTGFGLAVFETQ